MRVLVVAGMVIGIVLARSAAAAVTVTVTVADAVTHAPIVGASVQIGPSSEADQAAVNTATTSARGAAEVTLDGGPAGVVCTASKPGFFSKRVVRPVASAGKDGTAECRLELTSRLSAELSVSRLNDGRIKVQQLTKDSPNSGNHSEPGAVTIARVDARFLLPTKVTCSTADREYSGEVKSVLTPAAPDGDVSRARAWFVSNDDAVAGGAALAASASFRYRQCESGYLALELPVSFIVPEHGTAAIDVVFPQSFAIAKAGTLKGFEASDGRCSVVVSTRGADGVELASATQEAPCYEPFPPLK